ncbi:hypothetical protein DESA109040_00500 [Deinococcus saxicola]|uniref:hypothetical protein n=1 Tax=Deinococcus saxicola TaxID=249406 RepID=UPI0039F112C1
MAGTLTERDALENIRQQTERFEQLEAENHALRGENTRLKKNIEQLERVGPQHSVEEPKGGPG